MSRALMITGATGKQGGSVIAALLAAKANFQVLAVTRDPSSPSAKRLAEKSSMITLVEGNLNDVEAIFRNAKKATTLPIWGVFSVQTFAMNKTGPLIEEKQGRALVDGALRHGVQHFVYSSADRNGERSSENPTNVPHFVSKHNIEQHLFREAKGTGMGWTVLRPVAFMENFDGGFVGKVFAAAWKITVKSRPLQLVATADIGEFATKVFMDPARYSGKSIALAGDELTYEDMNAVFKQRTGSEVPKTWDFLARLALWLSEELGTMFTFFEKEGFGANVQELKTIHPDLTSFSSWLDKSPYVRKEK
ncbi:uncharacterized protein JN550_012949 [Neoarthrinium moseri]|uniref:uncharacterized protein n=1 Tax=Neoarthrinium moseri TaxID=1658444 RepID=UPI001FDDE35B|nr:uncharacterized protein JN550_012949 [Neoarthrinium moseri]KAI1857874.1 hypothetical protein JN550_012949 [Neoarthrinium moseri]